MIEHLGPSWRSWNLPILEPIHVKSFEAADTGLEDRMTYVHENDEPFCYKNCEQVSFAGEKKS